MIGLLHFRVVVDLRAKRQTLRQIVSLTVGDELGGCVCARFSCLRRQQLVLPDEGVILKAGRAMVDARLEAPGREPLPIQFAMGFAEGGWIVEKRRDFRY